MRAGGKAHPVFAPALLAAVGTALLALPGCKVVYDEPPGQDGGPARAATGFDPGAFVDGIWASKVTPFLSGQAVPLTELIPALAQDPEEAGKRFGHRADAEGSPWSFAVKGQGKILSAHTESRAGTLVVEVAAGGEKHEVTLQIGPVVRGNAVRDCLPFLSFGDVTNQIEFAQVGRAMNERALKAVHGQLEGLAPGALVAFTGATSLGGSPDELLITPTALSRAAGGAK